jgi:hypothetical protein
MRLQALLSAKQSRVEESTTARAAKIQSIDHYSNWKRENMDTALDLIENKKKADIFVSLEGETRAAWLARKISLM